MPVCICGIKVDRLQDDGLQCMICKKILHANCCNIKLEELEFVKNAYKCTLCLTERRTSLSSSTFAANLSAEFLVDLESENIPSAVLVLDETAVESSIQKATDKHSLSDVSADVVGVHAKGNSPVADQANSKLLNLACPITLDLLYNEIIALKSSNELLCKSMQALSVVNKKLLEKVELLEKHISSNKNERKNIMASLSPKRKKLKSSNHHTLSANRSDSLSENSERIIDKTISPLPTYADVTRPDIDNLAHSIPQNRTISTIPITTNVQWSVAQKKKKPKSVIIGSDESSDLDVYNRPRWVHLSSFKSTVAAENIVNYI